MKRQDVYDTWGKKRNQIVIRDHFTDEVMNGICHYERKKKKPVFDYQQLIELISAYLPVQAALVAAGALLGLARVVVMFAVILGY